MRISKEAYYLEIAKAVASRGTCIRRQYGAVIVKDDAIVATGYNGSPCGEPNCCDIGECYKEAHALPVDSKAARHGNQYGSCVAAHAESNALLAASRDELAGATLYLACLSADVDPAPCNFCDRLIRNAGIARVVTKAGAD